MPYNNTLRNVPAPGAATVVKSGNHPSIAPYNFQQPPKSVAVPGTYRDPHQSRGGSQAQLHQNVMHDRRVVRGNTYAQVLPVPPSSMPMGGGATHNPTTAAASRGPRRLGGGNKQAAGTVGLRSTQVAGDTGARPVTPEAVEGRKHIELQTEEFREALTDTVEEMTQETQTDPMLDRPPTPLFVPFKSGRDAETQIDENDLFDFDTEVEPLLEVVVGKTLEQAMYEVLHEEELEAMRRQQRVFDQRRKEEAMEVQRLEASEKRKFEEKELRKQQETARIRREREAREKLEARIYAKAFLGTLENRVFARLEDEGWFFDSVEREIELEFMPWLLSKAEVELKRKQKTREILDALIAEALQQVSPK